MQHSTIFGHCSKLTIFIIKRAPKLTSKACWPSQLERQNVNLAMRIFHESTAAGLSSFINHTNIGKPHQTVDFLNFINHIWSIFNVNWVGKDIRFNNPYLAPLHHNDERLLFLENVVKWLDCWRAIPSTRVSSHLKHLPVLDTLVWLFHS